MPADLFQRVERSQHRNPISIHEFIYRFTSGDLCFNPFLRPLLIILPPMRSLKQMETKKGAMEVFSTLCAFSCVTVRPSDRLDSRGSAGAAPRPRGALLGEHRSGDHLRPALQRSHRWDLCSALPRARPGHV